MAEVEYKGIKIGGNKLLLILPLIGTLGGGLWAGFEFYKDYMNMRAKIERYTAPDLSGFDKKLAVMSKSVEEARREMASVRTRVGEIQTVTRDIRSDTRAEAEKIYSGLSAISKRSRAMDTEVRTVMRNAESNLRLITTQNEKHTREVVDTASDKLKKVSQGHLEAMRQTAVAVENTSSRYEKAVRDVVESAATRLDSKINSANTRFDTKITQVDTKLDALEKRIFKALKRALDNPILRNK